MVGGLSGTSGAGFNGPYAVLSAPTDGSDATPYFNAALAANANVMVPPGKYTVGNIITNPGNSVLAFSAINAAYPGSAAALSASAKATPVLIGKSGASRIFNVDNAYPYRIEGFLIDGLNNGPNGIEQPTFLSKSAGMVRDCVIVNCNTAINANYGVVHAYQSTFGNNTTGVRNALDSLFGTCAFTGNAQHGMMLQSGAGSLSLTGCRFEWNGFSGVSVGDGLSLQGGAGRVAISGGWFDRNGWAGVCIEPGTDVSIGGGATFMRNGRLDNGLWAQAHIYLYGAARVSIGNITTAIGADDDGTGTISPRYCVAFDSPPGADVVIGAGQLTGFTVSAIGGTPPGDVTTTATATVGTGTKLITGLSTTASACVGQRVTGTGIITGNTIASIDSVSQITCKFNNTGGSSVAVTFKGGYVQSSNGTT